MSKIIMFVGSKLPTLRSKSYFFLLTKNPGEEKSISKSSASIRGNISMAFTIDLDCFHRK